MRLDSCVVVLNCFSSVGHSAFTVGWSAFCGSANARQRTSERSSIEVHTGRPHCTHLCILDFLCDPGVNLAESPAVWAEVLLLANDILQELRDAGGVPVGDHPVALIVLPCCALHWSCSGDDVVRMSSRVRARRRAPLSLLRTERLIVGRPTACEWMTMRLAHGSAHNICSCCCAVHGCETPMGGSPPSQGLTLAQSRH